MITVFTSFLSKSVLRGKVLPKSLQGNINQKSKYTDPNPMLI